MGDDEEIKKATIPHQKLLGLFWWDGPGEDVLGRFAAFAICVKAGRKADVFIRLTGDCPWICPDMIRGVAQLVTSGSADFASTVGWDEPWIDGYDVEAFTRELLLETDAETQRANHREHVTPAMKMIAKRFCVYRGYSPMGTRRWTLDTAEDLAWFRAVAKEIDVTPPNHPTYRELVALEERCPELRR
jgi:spore coat polysaccharide biosynthesis protein SpsF